MTSKQKRFVLDKLIPFVLREQGRGFEMSWWRRVLDYKTYAHESTDKVVKTPSCGTVCCLGGSIEMLKLQPLNSYNFHDAGEQIGLDANQSDILFSESIRWPAPFEERYVNAKTPLAQAKIAVALLKEVVRTNGACLNG